MLARTAMHAPRHIARPWAGAAAALLAMGLLVHGGVLAARRAFPEPLAGKESLALNYDIPAIPAHLGPLHALLLLIAPPWLAKIRLLLGLLPFAAAAVIVERSGCRFLDFPWTGVA